MDASVEKANIGARQLQIKESECKKQQEQFFQRRMPDILTVSHPFIKNI